MPGAFDLKLASSSTSPFDARSGMGLYSAAERTRALETAEYTQDAPVKGDEFDRTPAPAQVAVIKPKEVKITKAPSQGYGSSTELLEAMTGIASDAPLCMTCGVKMRQSGACYVCEGCGNTSGCS